MRDELFDVTDKICIVTGGLGQIGQNFTKALYERGAKVAVFTAHPTPERVERIFPSDQYQKERFKAIKVDINKKDTIEAALDELQELWKEVPDVLVNCAGIDTQPSAPPEVSGPFEKFPEEVFREVVDVNLVGTFLMTQAVGARMAEAGKGGSIINIGSIYGMVSPVQDIYAYKEEQTGVPFIKPVAYSAAKSGIYNLTRYCATYWGKKGIRVNTLTPAGVWRDTQDEVFIQNFTSRIPMGRMSREDEYNGAVIFLASRASSFMTGANLVIDGGWTAW
ncbi:SDR family oxidoreductase [Schaedlerella arabinosiphila]|jgi:Dehydrogenases with different specificities (related to short-chain alcohol dehydrogenases)|uniref:SDR family oxidoreductase n=1 Tax=Schaedlerella arabinosiphila TaxID=2044587 RepID=A0A426DMH9_9FIRM|nr:SDR family oxidoreductase [Schaedlerella arabinosiphila]RRK33985.1 SDR family oxidoreductase [Schaedlerella arabinosiphila]